MLFSGHVMLSDFVLYRFTVRSTLSRLLDYGVTVVIMIQFYHIYVSCLRHFSCSLLVLMSSVLCVYFFFWGIVFTIFLWINVHIWLLETVALYTFKWLFLEVLQSKKLLLPLKLLQYRNNYAVTIHYKCLQNASRQSLMSWSSENNLNLI